MRAPYVSLVLFLVLALVGCSFAPGLPGQPSSGVQPSSSTSAAPSTANQSQPQSNAGDQTAAIKAIIQRANEEQQQAFAQNDTTIMKDTATAGYYDELVQINNDLSDGSVSAIKLVKIEWGDITVRDGNTAQASRIVAMSFCEPRSW